MCNSMIYGCSLSKVTLSIATPTGYEPDKKIIQEAKNHTEINLTTNPIQAIKNADVVVTDTFTSIHNDNPERLKNFLPKYQINEELMKHANHDAIFMHCLPAKRDKEVTASVIDGPQSVVWDEAENRLHSQKTLLLSLIRA